MNTLILHLVLKLTLAHLGPRYDTLPYYYETLPSSIHLKCGATIKEWRGSSLESQDIKRVEKACLLATLNFREFVKHKGYDVSDSVFYYNLSFIPDYGYRSLNSRFGGNITGYTVHEGRYIFNISDTDDSEFFVSLLHEFFHALSFHYGVFDQHSGNKSQKISKDESLAQEFTKKLIGAK